MEQDCRKWRHSHFKARSLRAYSISMAHIMAGWLAGWLGGRLAGRPAPGLEHGGSGTWGVPWEMDPVTNLAATLIFPREKQRI